MFLICAKNGILVFMIDSTQNRKEAPLIRSGYSKLMSLFRLIDNVIIFMTLWVIMEYSNLRWDVVDAWMVMLSLVTFGFFAEVFKIYDVIFTLKTKFLFIRMWSAWFLSCGTMVLILVLYGIELKHWTLYITWMSIVPVLFIGSIFFRRKSPYWGERYHTQSGRIGIVGANQLGKKIKTELDDMTWMGFEFVGFYDDRKPSNDKERRLSESEGPCGTLTDLVEDAKNGKIEVIYITLPMSAEARIKAVINSLADSTATVYIVPDLSRFDLLCPHVTSVNGIPALGIYDSPVKYHRIAKRIEDIVLSLLFLSILIIPMAIIALAIKLSSKGSVIFKQTRYGIGGEPITVWKFRSMTVSEDGNAVQQAKKNDARVTKLGGFLRKTSLDELPQFFNVLGGKMSIVGPRPHAVAHNEYYREQIHGYMLRHKVKPGITGWAQINGFRGETKEISSMEGRIKYDLEYIHNWSHWLDIKIIFLTFFKGFIGSKAY